MESTRCTASCWRDQTESARHRFAWSGECPASRSQLLSCVSFEINRKGEDRTVRRTMQRQMKVIAGKILVISLTFGPFALRRLPPLFLCERSRGCCRAAKSCKTTICRRSRQREFSHGTFRQNIHSHKGEVSPPARGGGGGSGGGGCRL